MFDLASLDSETLSILKSNGFDSIPFSGFVERIKDRSLDPDQNRIKGRIDLPPEEALKKLPASGDPDGERLKAIGNAAIDAGEVGVAVLNGGMATRFGGVVKGIVTAARGRSFLDLKLSQIAVAGRGRARALLMNSFASHGPTCSHLEGLDLDLEVRQFRQMASLRLTPSGELFYQSNGKPSVYTTGHGDFPFALKRSQELKRFIEGGGRYLTLSNVDNLAAGLDPRVIGMHIEQGRSMTVELVRTTLGDVGGFPALVDGKMIIVEAFRIPKAFDVNSIPVFNTNTFIFDAEGLEGDFDLEWFAVPKKVEGREAVQFERLVGQLTEFMEVTWLLVPRSGSESRFIPIKTPSDLKSQANALDAVLRTQGVV
jgi:UTP--glucose-1-phosphate uridylyltransferase